MFTISQLNVIESDEGFSIKLTDTGIIYCEGDKNLFAKLKISNWQEGLMIDSKAIKNWKDGNVISEIERFRIIENIRRAFMHWKLELQIA